MCISMWIMCITICNEIFVLKLCKQNSIQFDKNNSKKGTENDQIIEKNKIKLKYVKFGLFVEIGRKLRKRKE